MDRPVGTLSVSQNGNAQYSFPFTVPPGIGAGNAPKLSLQYSSTRSATSVCGLRWNLGGLSSIFRVAPSRAIKNQQAIQAQNIKLSWRLALDGAELVCIRGSYGAADAGYAREVDTSEVVTPLKAGGFVVTDQKGRTREYGTTEDSRTPPGSTGDATQQWKLSRDIDVHGNYTSYHYSSKPSFVDGVQPSVVESTTQVSYIDTITYTSNDRVKYSGICHVKFLYNIRRDDGLNAIFGQLQKTSYRLERVETRVGAPDFAAASLARAYDLTYEYAPESGESLLTTITERGSNNSALQPTKFSYVPGVSPQDAVPFTSDPAQAFVLRESSYVQSIVPVDSTGRGFTDIVSVERPVQTGPFRIVTHVAELVEGTSTLSSQQSRLRWKTLGISVDLPLMDSSRPPTILVADLNQDSRSDLIVPYRSLASGELLIAILRANGRGFDRPVVVPTGTPWIPTSRWLTMDTTQNGFVDLVQFSINQAGQTHWFQTFLDVNNMKAGKLATCSRAAPLPTMGNTLELFPFYFTSANTPGLVRIWEGSESNGLRSLNADVFACTPSSSQSALISLIKTTRLTRYLPEAQTERHTTLCDVNGDGVIDVVLCSVQSVRHGNSATYQISSTTFLHDGNVDFSQQAGQVHTLRGGSSSDAGRFYAVNPSSSRFGGICYAYPDASNSTWRCLSSHGSGSGALGPFTDAKLLDVSGAAAGSAAGALELVPLDLNGCSRAAWLAYSLSGSSASVHPIYNNLQQSEMLQTVVNPLGCKSEIEYAAATQPGVYETQVDYRTYRAPQDNSDVQCIGLSNYLVTKVRERNDESINSLKYNAEYAYKYRGAILNRQGRGWGGFSSVSRTETTSGIQQITTYFQQWPLVGVVRQIDTYGSGVAALQHRVATLSTALKADWAGDSLELQKSVIAEYESVKQSGKAPCLIIRRTKIENVFYDSGGKKARTLASEYKYDGESGNCVSDYAYEVDELGDKQRTSELWTFSSYAAPTKTGVAGLVSACKVSSSGAQPNFDSYSATDLGLTQYQYDDTGLIVKERKWSSDTKAFSESVLEWNDFGNPSSQLSPAGLRTVFRYTDRYPQYAIEVTASDSVSELKTSVVYDPRYGISTAKIGPNKVLNATILDEWGRTVGKAVTATQQDKDDFRINTVATTVASAGLEKHLSTIKLCRNEETSFTTINKASAYLVRSTFVYIDPLSKPIIPAQAYVDCKGRVRRNVTQDDGVMGADRAWRFYEYDAAGNVILKSMPYRSSSVDDVDVNRATLTIYDALKRKVLIVRPRSNISNGYTAISAHWERGGATRIANFSTGTQIKDFVDGVNSSSLETEYQEFKHINGKEKLVMSRDNSNRAKRWEYDAQGLLTALTDPANKIERRRYNSFGSVVLIDDPYQNPLKKSQGVTREYDASNRLVKERNAVGESVERKYDSFGRTTLITGYDSTGKTTRTTTFEFDRTSDAQGLLVSVDIEIPPSMAPKNQAVRKMRYEFKYDQAGRKSGQTLTLIGDKPFWKNSTTVNFTQSWTYDSLGRPIARVFPDSTQLAYEYKGLKPIGGKIKLPGRQDEDITASALLFNQFDMVSGLVINGPEFADGGFGVQSSFDVLGMPTKMSLLNAKTMDMLVDYSLTYSATDQIERIYESIENVTTTYDYVSRRLAASHNANIDRTYDYNLSGDLVNKNGLKLAYSIDNNSSVTTGTENGQSMIVAKSDAAGRMVERQVGSNANVSYTYDENSKMSSATSLTGASYMFSDQNSFTVVRQHSDGSIEVNAGPHYQETIAPDLTRTIRRNLVFDGRIVAIARTQDGPAAKSLVQLLVPMTDHKGSTTHLYDSKRKLVRRLRYDDYGSAIEDTAKDTDLSRGSRTFEGAISGSVPDLLDFQARMYDPLLGRFTTPDTILRMGQTVLPDGMNRMMFENNDPVNHTDPTGHFSWSFWLAVAIGVLLILAAVIVTVATFGAGLSLIAAIAVGAGVGFLLGAGVASVSYAWKHRDVTDTDQFWKGWGVEVAIAGAIGAVTGAITGGLGAYWSAAGSASKAATAALENSAVEGTGGVLGEVGETAGIQAESEVAGTTNIATENVDAESGIVSRPAGHFDDPDAPLMSFNGGRGAQQSSSAVTDAATGESSAGSNAANTTITNTTSNVARGPGPVALKKVVLGMVMGPGANVGRDFATKAADNWVYGTHKSVSGWDIAKDIIMGAVTAGIPVFSSPIAHEGGKIALQFGLQLAGAEARLIDDDIEG